jgi:hypothetical protein
MVHYLLLPIAWLPKGMLFSPSYVWWQRCDVIVDVVMGAHPLVPCLEVCIGHGPRQTRHEARPYHTHNHNT